MADTILGIGSGAAQTESKDGVCLALEPRKRAPAIKTEILITAEPAELLKGLDRYQPEEVISKASFRLSVLKYQERKILREFDFLNVFLGKCSDATAGVVLLQSVVSLGKIVYLK